MAPARAAAAGRDGRGRPADDRRRGLRHRADGECRPRRRRRGRRGAGRGGRWWCCAARATMAATGLSRRGSWPSAAGRCALALLGDRAALQRRRRARGRALDRRRSSRSTPAASSGAGLVIDAIFGAGLARPVEGEAARGHRGARSERVPVVAVDVPSGVDGASGAVRGIAPRAAADRDVFPPQARASAAAGARICAARLVLAPIGIPAAVLDSIGAAGRGQSPGLVVGACSRGPAPRATNTRAGMPSSPAAR